MSLRLRITASTIALTIACEVAWHLKMRAILCRHLEVPEPKGFWPKGNQ